LGREVTPLLSAVSLTAGLSCVIGYLIQRGGRTIGTVLSLLFYKIGAITGRNMGRKSKRTVMCLLLLSTSMSFLITMSGIETNLNNGIENSLGGFLGADLIVVSDANFEKELAEKIFNLRNQVDVEVATPVYTDRQILYNSGDYRRYNIEGSLMLMENDFFETANIKFSPDTPNNIVPVLYSQLRVCIVTRSLAGTLNIRIGDHVAIKVAETRYDDLGNEYTEEVLEKLRVIGIAETTSFQYFTVGGAPLDKVCMTPYSNWGHLHPKFYFEDELVKEDNSEEQLLATVILIKTKPNANLEELREAILDEFDDSYDIEKIVTREDLAEQYIGNVKAVFDVFKTAFSFSIGITVIGVSQVLFMNLRGRRREFGLLKAIGMSEIQLAMMVISEALFLSVAAFLIGYLGGFLTWRQIADIMGLGGFQIPMLLEREEITNLFAVSLATSLSSVIYPTFTLHRSTPNQLLYEKGD
jgi:ABC-type antimicrobial peptide transport system permease subunit